MVKNEMTIHEALCEIKLLKSKFQKTVSNNDYVKANKVSNSKIDGVEVDKFKDTIRKEHQSTMDLLTRLQKISAAVSQSNSVTKITVGKDTYTVAEAIGIKNNIIPLKQYMRDDLANKLQKASLEMNVRNRKVEEDGNQIIENSAVDKNERKNPGVALIQVRETYIDANKVELVEGIDVRAEIKKLDDEIDEFLTDLDSALSVSNAITKIKID